MSTWNHRVVKTVYKDDYVYYGIREVFYNDDGSISGYTESAVNVMGEEIDDLRQTLEWMLSCLDKSVLVDGEVEFVNPI